MLHPDQWPSERIPEPPRSCFCHSGESPEESKVITAAEAAQSLDPSSPNYKKKRKLTKKLREIEALEAKDQETLTDEQKEKLTTKETVLESLTAAL